MSNRKRQSLTTEQTAVLAQLMQGLGVETAIAALHAEDQDGLQATRATVERVTRLPQVEGDENREAMRYVAGRFIDGIDGARHEWIRQRQ